MTPVVLTTEQAASLLQVSPATLRQLIYRGELAAVDSRNVPVSRVTMRSTLTELAAFTDEQGFCYPSVKRIAENAGLSVRSVRYAIEALIVLGLITVVDQSNGFKNTRYHVNR